MKFRALRDSDYDQLHRLYRAQTDGLPFHHRVGREQFRQDLLTTRFIRNPDHHHAKARIALVAAQGDKVRAFVSGGMVTRGDEVTQSKTGYVQAIIGTPDAADEIIALLAMVLKHLRRFRPKKIVAQDGCLSPVFFADSASTLPLAHAWIGQMLLDTGFSVSSRGLRMVAPLDRERDEVEAPDDLRFYELKHEMLGVDPRFDFGCLLLKPPYERGDGVVWCGNFYSGAFVNRTAFRSLYINWFTIIDDQYRRRGLGRLMLQYCLRQAQKRGAKYASLLTADDNFTAHNLYLSEGFEVADVTHSFEWGG